MQAMGMPDLAGLADGDLSPGSLAALEVRRDCTCRLGMTETLECINSGMECKTRRSRTSLGGRHPLAASRSHHLELVASKAHNSHPKVAECLR